MASPLLTFIIPTLNSEKTLQCALDSILCQEYGDLEILVVDSVSKDGTMDIVRAYAGKDARIRFLSEPDKGIYDAMNKGITLARGEWIYFLGSDDRLYDPQVLNAVTGDLRSDNFDLVYGNILTDKDKTVPYAGSFTYEKLLKKNMSHQAIFCNKRVFDRVGRFNTRYKGFADWDWTLRCFQDPAIRARHIDRVIAEFNTSGVSSVYDLLFMREVLLPAKLDFLADQGIHRLRKPAEYDTWWRMIRNAEIRNMEDLHTFAGERPIPAYLANIVKYQSKVSLASLKTGWRSKGLMMLSYIRNRLAGNI